MANEVKKQVLSYIQDKKLGSLEGRAKVWTIKNFEDGKPMAFQTKVKHMLLGKSNVVEGSDGVLLVATTEKNMPNIKLRSALQKEARAIVTPTTEIADENQPNVVICEGLEAKPVTVAVYIAVNDWVSDNQKFKIKKGDESIFVTF